MHRTPVHTTAALLLICAALWIGSYPLGIGAQNLWATGRTQPGTAWLQLRAAGFSPPETLYALQVSRGDVAANPATDLFVVPVGLLCYALAAMWLGCLALFRFRRMVEDAHSENSQRDAEHLTQPQSQEGALTAVP